jgi:hypothetical protein
MAFDYDRESAERLGGGMNMGGGIMLPFDTPNFWWMNGDPRQRALAQATPALYFGGWAAKFEAIEAVKKDRENLIPGGLVQTDIYTQDNKNFVAYTTRNIVCALIGFRSCWVLTDPADGRTQRAVEFVQGARQHMQVLALMAYKDRAGAYHPWGPVQLTVKGYMVSEFGNQVKQWQRLLSPVLKQIAPGLPATAFYMSLGTFGPEPVTRSVGKTAKSPITPVHSYQPENITEDTLTKIYAGKEGVAKMAAMLDQAGEWLNAWKTRAANSKAGAGGPPAPDFDDMPSDEEYAAGSSGDDIPF